MAAISHSFSTKSEADSLFVESLKISERREGRANFSWVVIQALKDYGKHTEVALLGGGRTSQALRDVADRIIEVDAEFMNDCWRDA